jgi:hypothetical protein
LCFQQAAIALRNKREESALSAVATQMALQSKKATTALSVVDHPEMGLASPVTGLVSPVMDLVSLVSGNNANPGNGRSRVSGGTRRSSESPGTTVEVAEVLNLFYVYEDCFLMIVIRTEAQWAVQRGSKQRSWWSSRRQRQSQTATISADEAATVIRVHKALSGRHILNLKRQQLVINIPLRNPVCCLPTCPQTYEEFHLITKKEGHFL